MGQMVFFDIANRYAGLDAKNDPLVKIDEVVPWETFRARLEAVWRVSPEERKSAAGVRRGKAALFQWVQVPPGHRSSRKQPEQSWR